MVQQWAHIDPKTTGSQYLPDFFNVRQRIASGVQKETRANTMPTIQLTVNVDEIAGHHTKLDTDRQRLRT